MFKCKHPRYVLMDLTDAWFCGSSLGLSFQMGRMGHGFLPDYSARREFPSLLVPSEASSVRLDWRLVVVTALLDGHTNNDGNVVDFAAPPLRLWITCPHLLCERPAPSVVER